jgi:hypothetical protein
MLGPTNPLTTNVAGETLGFRRSGFSPDYVLLMPAFSLPTAPINFAIYLHRNRNAPLPPALGGSGTSVCSLILDHLRR